MKHLFKKAQFALLTCLCSVYATAQGLKINSFSELEEPVKEASTSFTNMVWNVIAVVIAIPLLFVIWEVGTNKPQAKTHFIAWLVSVAIYLIARFII